MKGEFYKMEFRAWNVGTVDLTLEQEAAYLRLCHAMYDVRGPVPNTTRFLQSIFRCGNTKAVTLVNQLIAAGKIAVTADGSLYNHRVSEELADREKVSAVRRVAGERGGSVRRANAERVPSDPRATPERVASDAGASAANPLDLHKLAEAIASTLESREEKSREEKKGTSSLRSDVGAKSRRRATGVRTRIAEDAQPNDRQRQDASERGLSIDEFRLQWGRFRDFHLKNGTLFADWNAAWRNWLDSPIRVREAAGGGPGSKPRTRSAQDDFLAAAREANDDLMKESDDGAGPFDGSRPGLFGAGRPRNGHAYPDLLEPAGGDLRFSPPRLAGPPRPH